MSVLGYPTKEKKMTGRFIWNSIAVGLNSLGHYFEHLIGSLGAHSRSFLTRFVRPEFVIIRTPRRIS